MGKSAFATHFLNNNHQYGRMGNIMDIIKHINGGGRQLMNTKNSYIHTASYIRHTAPPPTLTISPAQHTVYCSKGWTAITFTIDKFGNILPPTQVREITN
jgi:hypothetical protein